MNEYLAAWIVVLLVGFLGLLFLGTAAALLTGSTQARILTGTLYCPEARRSVVLRYRVDGDRGPSAVLSCTAFADPAAVTCQTRCLTDHGRVVARAVSGPARA